MCLLPPPSLSLPALHVSSIPTVRLACPLAAHPARLPAAVSPPARCHTACLSTVRSPLPTSPCRYNRFCLFCFSALHRGRTARALPPLPPATVLPSCRRLLRSGPPSAIVSPFCCRPSCSGGDRPGVVSICFEAAHRPPTAAMCVPPDFKAELRRHRSSIHS